MMASSILSDTIPCGTLSIQQETTGDNEEASQSEKIDQNPDSQEDSLELLSA